MILDIVLILVLCLFSSIGYKKGMLLTLFSIFTFMIALYLSYLFVPIVSNIINSLIPLNNLSSSWINEDKLAHFMSQNSKFAIIIKVLLHSGNNAVSNNVVEIIVNAVLFILLGLMFRHILKKIVNIFADGLKRFFIVGTFDKMCGLFFGFLKGMLVACLICFVMLSISELNLFDDVINSQIDTSTLVTFFCNGSNYLIYTFFGY